MCGPTDYYKVYMYYLRLVYSIMDYKDLIYMLHYALDTKRGYMIVNQHYTRVIKVYPSWG
jgi:hypothetical protein